MLFKKNWHSTVFIEQNVNKKRVLRENITSAHEEI